jgi:hypothetical protein
MGSRMRQMPGGPAGCRMPAYQREGQPTTSPLLRNLGDECSAGCSAGCSEGGATLPLPLPLPWTGLPRARESINCPRRDSASMQQKGARRPDQTRPDFDRHRQHASLHASRFTLHTSPFHPSPFTLHPQSRPDGGNIRASRSRVSPPPSRLKPARRGMNILCLDQSGRPLSLALRFASYRILLSFCPQKPPIFHAAHGLHPPRKHLPQAHYH